MNGRNIKTSYHATIAIALVLFFGMAFAETAKAAPNCDVSSGLENLEKAKSGENDKNELDVRRELLSNIAECSKEEAKNGLEALKNFEPVDSLKDAKLHIEERLAASIEYANIEKSRLADVGLRGTRDIARSLKEWRMNTLLPASGNASNLILWHKSNDLIVIAESRQKQINQSLKILKLSDREEIKSSVSAANSNLEVARKNQERAEKALREMADPKETAALIHSSLYELSKAYGSFFKISEGVKKILPL